MQPIKPETVDTDELTRAVLNEIIDDDDLFQEAKHMMSVSYRPFLNQGESQIVNAHHLKQRFSEKLQKWMEWLPKTPIDSIGAGLAGAAFRQVDWDFISKWVLEHVE